MSVIFPDLLAEVRSFRAEHPAIRYVDLIALDIPGHFYGKRYPMDMLEKVAAGAPLKLPQNCVLLGTQGGLYPIGDYCFADGDGCCPAPGAGYAEAGALGKGSDRPDADHVRRHCKADRIRAS